MEMTTVWRLPDSDRLELVELYPLSEVFLFFRFPVEDRVEVGDSGIVGEFDLSLIGLVGKTSESKLSDCSLALWDISCLKIQHLIPLCSRHDFT